MDLDSIKFGFISYLQELEKNKGNTNQETDYSDFSDISIFTHAKEFKDYISDEFQSTLNIKSMNVTDILNLEIKNGKLVDPETQSDTQTVDDEETEIIEEDVNVGTEENSDAVSVEVPQSAAAEQDVQNSDQGSVADVLNVLLQNKEFMGKLDTDESGQLDTNEYADFINSISGLDNNSENISIDDITAFLASQFEETEIVPDEETEIVQSNETQTPETNLSEPQTQPMTQNASSPSSGGGTGNYSSPQASYSPSNNVAPQINNSDVQKSNLDNMSASELKTELDTANKDLTEKQENLSAIQNGTDDVVAPLKEAMQESLENYTDALEKENTEEASRLSEVTQQIELAEAEQRETEEKKQSCEDKIEIENKNVDTYNQVMENCIRIVTDIDTHISELETSKSSIPDDPEHPEAKAQQEAAIDAQIQAAQQEREAMQAQADEAKANMESAQQRLDDAQEELDGLNASVEQNDENLEALKKEQEELEGVVFEQNPELKNLKDSYIEAKDNYTTTREDAITSAKEDIAKQQDYTVQVSTKLEEVKKVENDKLYSTKNSKLGAYDPQRGQSLVDAAESLHGDNPYSGGHCAGGVEDAIEKGLGQVFYGHAYQLADVLANADGWAEVTDSFAVEDLQKAYEDGGLPPGAIVVWSQYDAGHTKSNGQYGHTFIADGKGNEISDFKSTVSISYASWHATFRVFIPTEVS